MENSPAELASVVLNKKSGYIDTAGKVIIPLKYDECNEFQSGTATVWMGQSCGLIDKKGKILIPIKYSLIDETWDADVVQVSIYNEATQIPKFGLMTRTGKALLPVSYDQIGQIINGSTIIQQAKLYGYFIINTKLIIPGKYDKAENFSQGFAAVSINKKWGFIDQNGKLAIPLEYDRVTPLESGYTEVRKNGVSSIFSKQLKTTTQPGGTKEFELVATSLKQLPVPSIERDVIPGVFTMKVPASLKPNADLLLAGLLSVYTDDSYSASLMFAKNDNKKAIHALDAMLQFKAKKTAEGFTELGSINYSSPSKISFVGFYGLMPDPRKPKEDNEEAYVFFSKPGEIRECWSLYYKIGKGKVVQIENDIESFLETMKVK